LHEVFVMRLSLFLALVSFGFASTGVLAQSVPPAISTDPPADTAHPAAMTVLHIPSHGVLINGLVYSPAGKGPHPTLVICHGLPGNEKNLDLAQAVRREGWNAVTFNYRGSWGSPGPFRFAQNLETLSDVTAESMVAELKAHAKEFVVAGTSEGLARIPVLALTANDHLAPQTDALVAAIKAKGGTKSDHRIALESTVITWLAGLN
jgi:predicted alpha/beta-fold hydrolase